MTDRHLKLSQREWDVVASLLEMASHQSSLSFYDWSETNGTGIADRVRERMRTAENGGWTKGCMPSGQEEWRHDSGAIVQSRHVDDSTTPKPDPKAPPPVRWAWWPADRTARACTPDLWTTELVEAQRLALGGEPKVHKLKISSAYGVVRKPTKKRTPGRPTFVRYHAGTHMMHVFERNPRVGPGWLSARCGTANMHGVRISMPGKTPRLAKRCHTCFPKTSPRK